MLCLFVMIDFALFGLLLLLIVCLLLCLLFSFGVTWFVGLYGWFYASVLLR